MTNRCKRCNRELSDPYADYGWRCAQILGVSDRFSDLDSEEFKRFLKGIKNADEFMGNAELTQNQKNGIYSAHTKMALWDGIDKNKVKEAKKDSFSVLSGGKGKTDLKNEITDFLDYWNGKVKDAAESVKRSANRLKDKFVDGLLCISKVTSQGLDKIGLLDDVVNVYMKTGIDYSFERGIDWHKDKADENWELNKNVDLSKYNGSYINDQNHGPVGKLRYGLWDMYHNGCELIAVYNSLVTLGEKPDIKKIAYHFENGGQKLLGIFGTSPFANEKYFKDRGYETKLIVGDEKIENHELPKADAYIITFINNGNIGDGVHTVSFKKNSDNDYEFFNHISNKKNKSRHKESLEAMLQEEGDVPMVLLCISKKEGKK